MRCLRLLFCLTLLLLGLAHNACLAAVVRLPGDADRDGDVDISDLVKAYNNYTGPGRYGKTADHGDTDVDGDVDIRDLIAIQNAYTGPATPRTSTPNIIFIYVDDMGYGDIAAFGADDIATPRLDALATNGTMLNHAYNSSAGCTTSRAAMLTGSYHPRLSILQMFAPDSPHGLNPDEITIAELFKTRSYQTAMVGKWHLGHPEQFMPWSQGFDRYYGIPVSHDYSSFPETDNRVPIYLKEPGRDVEIIDTVQNDETAIDGPVAQYTQRFTDKAIQYLRERDPSAPMYLYLAYCMPHVKLAVTGPFDGVSPRGLYGDVMAELDHNIGRIIDELEDQGIAGDTAIVFASDNGPWLNFGNHGGSAGPLREGKRTVFDGGVRTPCIVYWPGQVPVQQVDTPVAVMDFYSTFAGWAGAALPDDRKLDAVDLSPLLMRDTDSADYDHERPIALYAYYARELHAVRRGKWKLVLPHRYQTVNQVGNNGNAGSYKWVTTPLALFDMVADPGETANLADQHPDIVDSILENVDSIRQDLGDSSENIPPSNAVRQLGFAGGI